MAKTSTKREASGTTVLQQARHYMRFLRYDQGETEAEIAKSEGVGIKAVEKSISMVKFHRGLNTQQNLNTAVVGMLMGNLGRVDKTLHRMFMAKNYIEHKQADGSTELVPIDDTKVQMQALEIFGKYLESMQPKGGGMNLKIQQNNANMANAHSNARSGGFEEVLHGIISNVRSHNQLPPETADVIDADDDGEDEEEDA